MASSAPPGFGRGRATDNTDEEGERKLKKPLGQETGKRKGETKQTEK
jgi:hypothetical protein